MPAKYYEDKLYPFQDEILKAIEAAEVDFYLTGGTALSRCYLMHRYSDDLDFFLNAHAGFKSQSKKVISLFKDLKLSYTISTTTDTFIRILIHREEISLKIDFVNDVPYRYGTSEKKRIFYQVDNWRNILSNKICALSRREPKDIVDVLFIADRYTFSWEDILYEAREKDLWIEPIELCKIIENFPSKLLIGIKWISQVDIDMLAQMIRPLRDDIFYGNDNSLVSYMSISDSHI
jgi:hypothetical protein